jgi:hypothetical protein
MSGDRRRPPSEGSRDFLLAEYRYLADSFWRNEEGGEKRVNFFITLVTAVIAALVALATRQGSLTDGQLSGVAAAACLGLLAVGILTFKRLIHRNMVTDEYKRAMDLIRGIFPLEDYDPFPKSTSRRRSFGRGGLTDLVAAANSIIAAAVLGAVAGLSDSVPLIIVAMAAGFVGALGLHIDYLDRRYGGMGFIPIGRAPEEYESTLVISAEAPDEVIRELENLGGIGGFRLVRRETAQLRDRYYDTLAGVLADRRLALRLRELDGELYLTLKGPSGATFWGRESRFEIEHPYSDKALTDILVELRKREIALPSATVPTRSTDPVEMLAANGLELIQDRVTTRRLREVAARGDAGRPLAELGIDSVVYTFGRRAVRHHEVEVEAKAKGGKEAVDAVTQALCQRYWPSLRPWRYGKLPTGKGIAQLLERRAGRELLARGGVLKPTAYTAILRVLDGD